MSYKEHVISTGNEKLSGAGNAFRTPQRPTHDGIDFVDAHRKELKSDVYIMALAGGKVAEAGFGSSVGYYVDIAHDGKILTRYFHMKARSVLVKKGDTVTKGQNLGIMGTTGHSTGIHLHFGVKENSTAYNNGVYVDPVPYLYGSKTIGVTSPLHSPSVSETQKIQEIREMPRQTDSAVNANDKDSVKHDADDHHGGNPANHEQHPNAESTDDRTSQQTASAVNVNDKVKVKQGAKDYNGGNLASFVYKIVYDVQQVSGERVVIGLGGKVTAAVHARDLQKV
jgi:hypothetical protein